jgi:UDP-N-acetylmuramate dehydrogenase
MQLLQNHSLKKINTFGVDVKSKYFIEIFSEEELIEVLLEESIKTQNKLILGGGSNILFTKDYEGLVIKNSISGIKIVEEDSQFVIIESGAGVIWNDLVKFCVERNYGGIENLTLIPGTVGAAPIQNIGAYGQELADTFISLNGIFLEDVKSKTFSKNDCRFSYRNSIFKTELKDKVIITSVRLRLTKQPQLNTNYKSLKEYLHLKGIMNPTISDISKSVETIRKTRLPDPAVIGNAGSFFKNPEVNSETFSKLESEFNELISFPSDSGLIKLSAGWLIEKCGWKGKRVGDVGTSLDHSLVICNFGNATGLEILEYSMRIKEEVANKFGIILKEEVNII